MERNELQAPEWQMEDAYGHIGSEAYEKSVRTLTDKICDLKGLMMTSDDVLGVALECYDVGTTHLASLKAFVKCIGAKDSTDVQVSVENARLAILQAQLTEAFKPFLENLLRLDPEDSHWEVPPFNAWQSYLKHERLSWERSLSEEKLSLWRQLQTQALMPLGAMHKSLMKDIGFVVKDSEGNEQRITPSKLTVVLKGHPDSNVRHQTARGLEAFMQERGECFAEVLNALNGLRRPFIDAAQSTPIRISLHQNAMSAESLAAMLKAIEAVLPQVQHSIVLRAHKLGYETMPYEDLMAPLPDKSSAAKLTYPDAVKCIKEALTKVNPELADFVQMMVENRWVDAVVDEKKIGGAFYTRFDLFKIPRVFGTFMGNVTTLIQQSHELGHAFHYWVMRDLPTVQTNFPMTLTETASTFNEAVVRHYLLQKATSQEALGMVWQDVCSAANFLCNTTARFTFENSFLEKSRHQYVNAETCCELMQEAWSHWYGKSAKADRFLWAHKLHFYKKDQLLYNYPYTVGFLLSQALMREWFERGEAFYPFYKALLRDTGVLSVDDVIRKHFGADPQTEEFWNRALERVLQSIELFETLIQEK